MSYVIFDCAQFVNFHTKNREGYTLNWNLNSTNITHEYSYINLKTLLEEICKNKNTFSHYEFAKWCDNLTMIFDDREWDDEETVMIGVARDIECQWDLFLVNTYSLEELQSNDLSKVELPQQWFIDWKKEMD